MRCLRQARRGVLAIVVLMVFLPVAGAAEPVKVGVYARALGGQATFKALAKEKEVKAASFKDMKTDALLAYDAVIICACTLDQPEQLKALRVFLACGGGLVLNHSSCGRGRPETFFPAVVKKVVDRRVDSILVVKDGKHPIAAGLPEQFEHSYNDHLFLEPGPDGTVVVVDREGAPVVVAGAVGEGRVVFNGSLPGYWYDLATFWQGEREPVGGELQLVLNAAKWAGAGRVTALPADELAKRRKKAEADLKME
ncbi:MAG: ThuA domain-containing protein, partial [Planctomycetes bacterium]|nr:ThuA domain-containing protein [Planctomycetota bacterium]